MIPPSLAYLGLDISNYNLLKKALAQFSLESSAMLDADQQIYQHIPASDARLWATGNGWMTYGLMRDVSYSSWIDLITTDFLQLASVKMSSFAEDFSILKSDAEQTIAGVFKALFDQLGVRPSCRPSALNVDSSLGRQSAS